ncbi:MAG: DUF11 domain-containing protein [Methanobrevibacter sp.]|uniref:DUF11 domain-containing protein n=1 Tax=Methanobrevibacter sp. TaxID=66852 RepID=UPI0025FA4663|nr:DUF11 domain-containing protein [Methanobrevibacter sp.]MEE0902529.1 DUF11 domain-containing protein [Methanobrevibacter sp.]MEE0936269.1 DUF11 domain-containing protein [Methanobrevibacter sp.]
MFKKSAILIIIAFIFICSITTINAYEIDENQTDDFQLEVSEPEDVASQEVLSVPESNESTLNSDDEANESGAYIVLDNDADKENIYVGDYVTWILKAHNLGPDAAKNVKIHNILPNGLKYIKHTATKGTFNPSTGIWSIGDLTVEEGIVFLYITTKALTVGEKINEAYITSDTLNTNNETSEEEEIDVFARDDSKISVFEKHAHAKMMYETGNPIFLIFMSLLMLSVPIIKR